METAMKITFLTLVLLFLTGYGEPQAVTQAAAILQQTSKAKPQRVTPNQPAVEFTGKVIKERWSKSLAETLAESASHKSH